MAQTVKQDKKGKIRQKVTKFQKRVQDTTKSVVSFQHSKCFKTMQKRKTALKNCYVLEFLRPELSQLQSMIPLPLEDL